MLTRNIQQFFNLKAKDKVLFGEALLMLYLAKLMIVVLPFRICIRTIKECKFDGNPELEQLKSIKYAINRANNLAFWKNVCLVQSFAARWMLRRRGISSVFTIGVSNDSRMKFIAHAWLNAGDVEIVPKGGDYTIITSY